VIPTTTNGQATTKSARDLLDGRVLFVAGDTETHEHAVLVDPATEGLVLTSKSHQAKDGRRIKRGTSDVVTILEPKAAMSDFATPERPFIIPGGDTLFDTNVHDVLDGQLTNGATIAMTPTGYIRAGEPDTLRAVATAGNAFTRNDTLHHVFLSPWYFHPDHLRRTINTLRRSELPLAITVAHKTNPMTSKGVVEGLRQAFTTLDWAMLWRGDLAAFDTLAHGARSAAIGTRPSTRHGVPAGDRGQTSPDDKTPSVLVVGLARYIRSGKLRDWYAGAAPTCPCPVCGGRRLDRFEDTLEDHTAAMQHNLAVARTVRADLFAAPAMRVAWYEMVDDALLAHDALRSLSAVKVKTPSELKKWATRHAAPVTAASTVSSKNHDAAE
jgi:hypothetical protein